MLENWDFLISEMVVLLVLAALVGLVAGWLVFGRRKPGRPGDSAEVARLKAELETCRAAGTDQEAHIAKLEADLSNASSPVPLSAAERVKENVGRVVGSSQTAPDRAEDSSAGGTKPATLDAPRDGTADDLKLIKGVGPKLETLVNDLGFYHFDQIANWTTDEVAWVDANLKGFKGRVSRDGWVEQARTLAAGGSTSFSDKVKKGDVY